MGKDYYQILQLNRISKDKDIKTAYRRLALQYHPSKNRDDYRAARQFHDIAEAYDVLSHHQRRAIYDQYGEQGLKRGVPAGPNNEWTDGYVFHGDPERVYREFFGNENPFAEFSPSAPEDRSLGFGGLDGRTRKKEDPLIVRDLLVSLEDCYYGAVKKMQISRRVLNDDRITSSIREKIVSITIQRGWVPGTHVTFTGEGDQGSNNISSDVVFVVKDKPHHSFHRENADLIYPVKISLGQALTGTMFHIEHLDGRVLDIPVNEIVRPGYRKRIPNQGMPLMSNPDNYGDLLIEFDIAYPLTLNAEQKSLLREALLGEQNGKRQSLQNQIRRRS